MNCIRGPLYRLRTARYETDPKHSPLLQTVDRSIYNGRFRPNLIIHKESRPLSLQEHDIEDDNFRSFKRRPRKADKELFGNLVRDWNEYGFELSTTSCQLSYYVECDLSENERIRSVQVGIVQADTKIRRGPAIDAASEVAIFGNDKLRLYPVEIIFVLKDYVFPKYCILAHPDEQERDRWYAAVSMLIETKLQLLNGWDEFLSNHIVSDMQKAEQWMKIKQGEAVQSFNGKAARTARVRNGKVLMDVPLVFQRHSAVYQQSDNERLMDQSEFVAALTELGLELSSNQVGRLASRLMLDPPCPATPDKLDLGAFRDIVQSLRMELLMPSPAELPKILARIVRDSKNPFLSMLTPAEQAFLVEGLDRRGQPVSSCRTHHQGEVLVRQNEAGDSMFIILEGSLAVVMTFGSGAATTQREVATLGPGAVMGEMSLVLGKPRSATCVVKSDAAAVAEVTRTGITALLAARPSLTRELQDIVHRRDAANLYAAGRAAAVGNGTAAQAMAAYRARAIPTAPDGHNTPPPREASPPPPSGGAAPRTAARTAGGVRMPAIGGGAGIGAGVTGGRTSMAGGRSQSVEPLLPRSPTSPPPPSRGPGDWSLPATGSPAGGPGALGRGKAGRWVKRRGVDLFLVD